MFPVMDEILEKELDQKIDRYFSDDLKALTGEGKLDALRSIVLELNKLYRAQERLFDANVELGAYLTFDIGKPSRYLELVREHNLEIVRWIKSSPRNVLPKVDTEDVLTQIKGYAELAFRLHGALICSRRAMLPLDVLGAQHSDDAKAKKRIDDVRKILMSIQTTIESSTVDAGSLLKSGLRTRITAIVDEFFFESIAKNNVVRLSAPEELRENNSETLERGVDRHPPDLSKRIAKGKLVRTNLELLEGTKAAFRKAADNEGMSMAEFLRRAAFAAKHDPSILRRPEAEAAEKIYKSGLGESRWTKEAK
jgi:hypothetical protein